MTTLYLIKTSHRKVYGIFDFAGYLGWLGYIESMYYPIGWKTK